jgi:hypothetical protein
VTVVTTAEHSAGAIVVNRFGFKHAWWFDVNLKYSVFVSSSVVGSISYSRWGVATAAAGRVQ